MYPVIDSEELSIKVHRILLKMLKDGKFTNQKRLPPEAVLVEKLGVSRSVIRDALSLLESEGFITRKRGVGTVINQHVLNKTPRLDLENDFLLMLESEGYTSSTELMQVVREEDHDGSFLLVEKRVIANGKPAILIQDRVPEDVLPETLNQAELCEPIYHVLRRLGLRHPTVVMLDIAPKVGNPHIMTMLGIDQNEPYLEVMETGYDLDQNIVIQSTLAYRSDLFHFSILRKELMHHVK